MPVPHFMQLYYLCVTVILHEGYSPPCPSFTSCPLSTLMSYVHFMSKSHFYAKPLLHVFTQPLWGFGLHAQHPPWCDEHTSCTTCTSASWVYFMDLRNLRGDPPLHVSTLPYVRYLNFMCNSHLMCILSTSWIESTSMNGIHFMLVHCLCVPHLLHGPDIL